MARLDGGYLGVSLYIDHRPTDFDQVVGNEKLVEQLKTLLAKTDPPHAYLLTGPSGCGKTTIGRIIASHLGVSDDDFVEVDSADFRGIDTIRDMRRNALYRAMRGTRRMWLMDECHKLSNDAQNALLKGLEDPPAHAYFVLATTDPDKLLPTIKGRCVTFQVQKLADREMVRLLHKVSSKEGERVDRAVLQAIAERADGHSRDALQILEKVLVASSDDRMAVVEGSETLKSTTARLVQALLGRQGWKAVAEEIQKIGEDDFEQVRRGVLGYCTKVLLGGENDKAGEVLDEFREPFFSSGMAGLVLACYRVARS